MAAAHRGGGVDDHGGARQVGSDVAPGEAAERVAVGSGLFSYREGMKVLVNWYYQFVKFTHLR